MTGDDFAHAISQLYEKEVLEVWNDPLEKLLLIAGYTVEVRSGLCQTFRGNCGENEPANLPATQKVTRGE